MNREIETLLTQIESRHGVEILYACESGSRAWGFASPDSDYDIRFLYRRPIVDCYGVEEAPDTIEIPIEGDLDPGGWELRKALSLLRKSNGALLEWIHSPITYRVKGPFLNDLRALSKGYLSKKNLANHYRGMAEKTFRMRIDVPKPTAKSYLYALRAILASQHILDSGTPPPVPFAKLVDRSPDGVAPAIHDLLAWKAGESESASPGHLSDIDDFIRDALPDLGARIDALGGAPQPTEPFDACLRKWSLWPSPYRRPRLRQTDLNPNRVRKDDLLLFEGVSGSHCFGTNHEHSDIDLKGVFVAPASFLGGLETVEQVNDAKHDETYYEAGRFVSLLLTNNPNIVELLFTPESCIRFKHPAFDLLSPEVFLSQQCRQSFGNYAMGQIRKARGLNKKIVNPQPEIRHHLRHFCHVLEGQGSVPLANWLEAKGLDENRCGLVAVNHAPNTYALFYEDSSESRYRGLFSPKDDAALLCSSVPKEARPIAWISCNLDAFKAHCKQHREYWQWVEERNEQRYLTNVAHGRGYDSKNLMHTLRLLEQAIEIAREGRITLPRPNAPWLKKVREGAYEYDDLLVIAEDKHSEMEAAFDECRLPEKPSEEQANDLLLEVREAFLIP